MYRLDSLAVMNNYYSWILEEFRPFIGKRVLEVGAGVGTFTKVYSGTKGIEKVYLLEPSQELFPQLKGTFEKDPRIECVCLKAEDLSVKMVKDMDVDTIIMVNVLEHIADDNGLLKRFAEGMSNRNGGRILLFCPAFQLLFSHIDATAGHYRRYTKKSLKQKMESSGLNLAHLHYFNFIGFFSWLLFAKFLAADDFNKNGLKLYNSLIPYMQRIENIIIPPLGQSVIAVGEIKKV